MGSGTKYIISKRKGCVGSKIAEYPQDITIILPTSKKEVTYDIQTKTVAINTVMNHIDVKELNRMVTDLVYYDVKDFVIVIDNKLVHDEPYVK